ncbi:hypothetical protein [Pseudonocardia acaciae]|uniref:hypothetical protein n=1 Tax=Pseudonocardia acaciae TaxID=551276 RepID=UPI0012ECDFDD|nr:hypothetical protein [Pseudonocardia acaciae]
MAVAVWAVLCITAIKADHPILGTICLLLLVGCGIRMSPSGITPPTGTRAGAPPSSGGSKI